MCLCMYVQAGTCVPCACFLKTGLPWSWLWRLGTDQAELRLLSRVELRGFPHSPPGDTATLLSAGSSFNTVLVNATILLVTTSFQSFCLTPSLKSIPYHFRDRSLVGHGLESGWEPLPSTVSHPVTHSIWNPILLHPREPQTALYNIR